MFCITVNYNCILNLKTQKLKNSKTNNLSISGIKLTFVDDFELDADYLVHLSGNEGCGR